MLLDTLTTKICIALVQNDIYLAPRLLSDFYFVVIPASGDSIPVSLEHWHEMGGRSSHPTPPSLEHPTSKAQYLLLLQFA